MPQHPILVLASGSPRRRFLLHEAGLSFEVRPADVDESALPGEAPHDQALRLALDKARAVARACGAHNAVLGADTLVVLDGRVYGKPADEAEAVSHLSQLCGRTHRVITGVALVHGGDHRARALAVESEVTLRAATAHEIRAYVATGEPMDKAGAYALQGEGRRFVEKVLGSESNVIGLPMPETLALLREAGLRFEIRPADVDESALPGEAPRDQALRLALDKARAVASACGAHCAVLGADTLVVLDGRVYGKPVDEAEAVSHLSQLCGRTHRVITGVALVHGGDLRGRELAVESAVTLRAATPEEIRAYVTSGEPMDKAGAYALQGEGRRFVEKVLGSESNVIGLPVQETLALLREAGVLDAASS